MLPHSQLRNLLATIAIILLCFQQVSPATGHKCFVCSRGDELDNPEFQKLFGSQSLETIPQCADYKRLKKEDFIRECPPDSNGCLTKFGEKTMLKTCATTMKDECMQETSGVTICHCRKDLCNSPERKLTDPYFPPQRGVVARALHSAPESSINSANSDDEDEDKPLTDDSEEGSGDGDNDNDDYIDEAYFDDYDDEDSQIHGDDKDDVDNPPGDVDSTEPPPFIVEEEVSWKTDKKHLGSHNNNNNNNNNNDIGFDEGDEKRTGTNTHDPKDRKIHHQPINGSVCLTPLGPTLSILLFLWTCKLSL